MHVGAVGWLARRSNETGEPPQSPVQAARSNSTYADIFEFRVVENAVLGAFAPDAGLLDSPEGGNLGGDQTDIQADDTVLERFGDSPGAGEVASIEVRGQPEFGVIGHANGFGFRFKAQQWCDRTERLLPRHQHFGGHIRYDCRLDEG